MKEKTTLFVCADCCESSYLETEDWKVFACPKCGWTLELADEGEEAELVKETRILLKTIETNPRIATWIFG